MAHRPVSGVMIFGVVHDANTTTISVITLVVVRAGLHLPSFVYDVLEVAPSFTGKQADFRASLSQNSVERL